MIAKHMFDGMPVNKAFMRFVTNESVNVQTKKELYDKIIAEPSLLWCVPSCGEGVRKQVIKIVLSFCKK